jgi:hypothetical protein
MKIKINFESLCYNGHMSMDVYYNKEKIKSWQSSDKNNVTDILVLDVPDTQKFLLELKTYGKHLTDTLVDGDNIVADKAIKINRVYFDEIELNWELYTIPFITETGQTITNTAYLGFNGNYVFDISPDLTEWLSESSNELHNRANKESKIKNIDDFFDDIMS